MDHDRLFKELLTTFFAEFIDLFLPGLSAFLVRDSFEFMDKEVFTDVTEGSRHEADLVVKARFKDGNALFLIHLETQSRHQHGFPRRMFMYFARLHEKYGLPVYPVVLYSHDSPTGPEPDHYKVDFPDRAVLDFAYTVIQLNRLNWRDYVRQHNPVASALMAKMHIARAERPKVKLECLRLLATLHLNPAKMQLISGFVDSYLRLTAQEQRHFDAALERVERPEREDVMDIVTSWLEEGIVKGRDEGVRKIVVRLLKRQVGKLSASTSKALAALSTAQLEDLGDALLEFNSIDDLTDWLKRNA
jgi:hypothetical protein